MLHQLKIKRCYYQHIVEGKKKFEVRFNDRDYQVGDEITFDVISKPSELIFHPGDFYKIVYVHVGLGMEKDFVVLGIEKEVVHEPKD